VLFALAFLVLSISITPAICQNPSREGAEAKIGEAEGAFISAYEAVLDAERAGANVSDLIVKLNEAAKLLAEAENAYRIGNFSEAASKAEECSGSADSVRDEALTLKGEALAVRQNIFLQNLSITLVGSAVFLIFLFFVWDWFKRFYSKKLMKMKPEVAVDAED
jgi:hypothetical protein